jgi:Family of unknown function (DUF5990)
MADEPELPFRIVVEQAPPQVAYAVQLGRTELLAPARRGEDLVFEVRLRLKRGTGKPVFLGPAAQGPPQDRFIYVNSGTMAGQANSPWSRRAKVKLAGIDRSMVERALSRPGTWLEAHLPAIGKDGGPSCATIRLGDRGWQITGS